ncbi:class I glutamine amidotransferase-like protein [Bisporella sp. PMI_857]|nr:class I glutamine amidotransferase-like protein [Bisporella sp. PMI_857]
MASAARPRLLVVLSSQTTIPATGASTGWYLPELVHPYNALAPHVDITIASPKGGKAPVDPYSVEATKDDAACAQFIKEQEALWTNTAKLESFIGRANEFDGIFFVGGHGPMFDLATDKTSHALIREFYESSKLVSAVCHGPAALVNVTLSDGTYLVAGQTVTGLSNAEEDALQATAIMPFLLETELRNHGASYVKADGLFGVKVVRSGKEGNLVTGQNPPSAGVIGGEILKALITV